MVKHAFLPYPNERNTKIIGKHYEMNKDYMDANNEEPGKKSVHYSGK